MEKSKQTITEQIKESEKVGWLFILPYIIFFLVFVLYPLMFSFYLIFHRWDLVSPPEWVGLKNFSFLLIDGEFWRALFNTFVFLVIHIPLQIVVALVLAIALNQKIGARSFFRASFFLPVVISGAVVTILWQQLYSTDSGIINLLLSKLCLPKVPWLTDPVIAMPAIAIMATWKNVGFYIILFLSGLQNIPYHLHEAAEMEGTTKWQEFYMVTLPLLKPSMLLVVVLSTMGGFQLFIEPYVMTGGGPLSSTISVVLYMYKQAFSFQHMGYAATLGFALSIIILAVVLIQKKYLDTETYY